MLFRSKMSSSSRVLSAVLVAVSISVGCGGEPPEKEMQQAQGALDAARAAGADRFATEELAAAQAALTNARDAVSQRDYRLALDRALDSRERAQNAARLAEDSKAAARVEADHALTAAQEALDAAEARLKAAETRRVPARQLSTARRAVDTARLGVQEARTLFAQGDYSGTTARAQAASAALDRKSTRLNSSHVSESRMPSSA